MEKNVPEAQWLKLLKEASTAKNTPKGTGKVMADAYNRLKVVYVSKKFIEEIANTMVTQAEISTRLNDAKEAGHAAGLAAGKVAGRKEAVLAMAKKMLAARESIEKIHDYSGLSIAEIKALV